MAEHNFQVGVTVSGSATTVEFFCLTIAERQLPLEVGAVVCDRPDKPALTVVRRLNKLLGWDMKPVLVDKASFPGGPGERTWDITDEQSGVMAAEFDGFDVVSQQGFASRVRGVLLEERGLLDHHTHVTDASLINNHPGLLPATKGLYGRDVHKKAAADPDDATGLTIHGVAEGYDEGSEFLVHDIPMLPGDEWQDYERAVQAVEKVRTATAVYEFAVARQQRLAGVS